MLVMNNLQNGFLAIVAIITIALIGQNEIYALSDKMPYGSIGQEDENHVYVNGTLYLNVVFEKGNGQFMTIPAIVNETEKLLNEGLVQ